MKHKGNKNEYKVQQDREVMVAYRRIFCEHGGIVSVKTIYHMTAFAPASRFFVSDLQAIRTVKEINKGRTGGMRGARLRMYNEIRLRAEKIMSEDKSVNLSQAVSQAVRQPAPEMYISPRQVSAIIKQEQKRCYEERKRRLRHLL